MNGSNRRQLHRPIYGDIRVQAQAVWRGPEDIVIKDLAGTYFYGWSTLSLETKHATQDVLEARTVYANLFNGDQPEAVLRAVFWDGELMKRSILSHNQPSELVLPNRFVRIPIKRLQDWLAEFSSLSVPIDEVPRDDSTGSIRRLKIQREIITSMFEKIWQVHPITHASLEDAWDRVWTQMTEELGIAPTVPNEEVDEDFRFVTPIFTYDPANYRPNLLPFV